jgi:hypothetical protein
MTCTPSRCCPAAGSSSAPCAWITRCRRTVRDYERLTAHHETMLYRAMIIVMKGASPAPPAKPRMSHPGLYREERAERGKCS